MASMALRADTADAPAVKKTAAPFTRSSRNEGPKGCPDPTQSVPSRSVGST
jgi:hypothetical protein